MPNAKQAWTEWAEARDAAGAPDSEPEAFAAGWDAAVAVFEDKFFGGPTKEMVRWWFTQARESWDETLAQERSSSDPEGGTDD